MFEIKNMLTWHETSIIAFNWCQLQVVGSLIHKVNRVWKIVQGLGIQGWSNVSQRCEVRECVIYLILRVTQSR